MWEKQHDSPAKAEPPSPLAAALQHAHRLGLEDAEAALSLGLPEPPKPDLSGEWADTRTGPSLTAECLRVAGLEAEPPFDPWFTAICDTYEIAFSHRAANGDEHDAACPLCGVDADMGGWEPRS